MVQKAVKDGTGRRHVTEQLAPVLDRTVAGDNGGAVFVAAHDHLQQIFAGVFGEFLEPHIINDQEIGFEIFAQDLFLLVEGLLFEEVTGQIKDGAVQDVEVVLDGFVADGLGQVGFTDTGRTNKEYISAFLNELSGGQLINFFGGDAGIKSPVKVLQGFEAIKVGGFGATLQKALFAHIDFILEDEFEELSVRESIGSSFLEANVESAVQPGKPELFADGFKVGMFHGVGVLGWVQSTPEPNVGRRANRG